MKATNNIHKSRYYKLFIKIILTVYFFVSNAVYALPVKSNYPAKIMQHKQTDLQLQNINAANLTAQHLLLINNLAPVSYLMEPQKTFPKSYMFLSEAMSWLFSFTVMNSGASPLEALSAGLFLRLFFAAGIYFNELGHMLTAWIKGVPEAFSRENIKGNIPVLNWVKSLIPVLNVLLFSVAPKVRLDLSKTLNNTSAEEVDAFIRKKGFLAGTILHSLLGGAFLTVSVLYSGYFFSPVVVIILLSTFILNTLISYFSDYKRPDSLKGNYFCGLFGMYTFKELDYKKFRDVLYKSISFTEVRGKQAGGIFFISESLSFLKKIINSKRGTLAGKLLMAIESKQGLKPAITKDKEVVVQGHVRFGTSSPPSIEATHPHIYSDSLEGAVNV